MCRTRAYPLVIAALLLAAAAPAGARVGALTQLHGKAGCFAQQNAPKKVRHDCKVGRFGGNQMWDAAVSPDGRNLYVASRGGAVSVLRIDKHGRLSQPAGKAGCVSRTRRFGCTRVPQLSGSRTLAVSPDRRNVYVGSTVPGTGFGGVVVIQRNRRTGALHRSGCVGENGAPGCAPARALLAGVEKIVVSRDGRSVYAGSNNANPGAASRGAVAIFARGAGGTLTQLAGTAGCLSSDGSEGCAQPRGLLPECCGLALSPNSGNVYVSSSRRVLEPGTLQAGSGSLALASFARDSGGVLAQLAATAGCVNRDGSDGCASAAFGGALPVNEASGVVLSPDGHNVYLSHTSAATDFETNACSGTDNSVAAFPRDSGSGSLGALAQDIRSCGLNPEMSPDGKSLYAATGNFGNVLSLFSRNPATGALAHAGCIGHDARGCRKARHVIAPSATAVTPNGRYVYVISDDFNSGETIGVFRRSRR